MLLKLKVKKIFYEVAIALSFNSNIGDKSNCFKHLKNYFGSMKIDAQWTVYYKIWTWKMEIKMDSKHEKLSKVDVIMYKMVFWELWSEASSHDKNI